MSELLVQRCIPTYIMLLRFNDSKHYTLSLNASNQQTNRFVVFNISFMCSTECFWVIDNTAAELSTTTAARANWCNGKRMGYDNIDKTGEIKTDLLYTNRYYVFVNTRYFSTDWSNQNMFICPNTSYNIQIARYTAYRRKNTWNRICISVFAIWFAFWP